MKWDFVRFTEITLQIDLVPFIKNDSFSFEHLPLLFISCSRFRSPSFFEQEWRIQTTRRTEG